MLWSRSFTPTAAEAVASPSSSPVNSLIREVLIEGRNAEEKYEKDGYAIRWTFVNELELIFVVRDLLSSYVALVNSCYFQVAYQRILQLTYVEDLLSAIKALFVKLFEPFLTSFVASVHAVRNRATSAKASVMASQTWDFAKAFEGWDKVFDKVLRGLEDKAAQVSSV